MDDDNPNKKSPYGKLKKIDKSKQETFTLAGRVRPVDLLPTITNAIKTGEFEYIGINAIRIRKTNMKFDTKGNELNVRYIDVSW